MGDLLDPSKFGIHRADPLSFAMEQEYVLMSPFLHPKDQEALAVYWYFNCDHHEFKYIIHKLTIRFRSGKGSQAEYREPYTGAGARGN